MAKTKVNANQLREMVGRLQIANFLMSRQLGLAESQLNAKTNVDRECGFPEAIQIQDYWKMFKREGVATRVVTLFPRECWAVSPGVFDNEDEEVETEFEKEFKKLITKRRFFNEMERVDISSGIGAFGLLFLGFDDLGPNDDFSLPVSGVEAETYDDLEAALNSGERPENKLLYMRSFYEGQITIDKWDTDLTSPRFAQPEIYSLKFFDPNTESSSRSGGMTTIPDTTEKKVHWSRCIHVADERLVSNCLGTPRQESVFNYLMNIRKLLGGSAQMFWQGAFPGLSFELDPTLTDVELDLDAIKGQVEKYMNGLQRYLAVEGMKTNQLLPQVASPIDHLKAQLIAIAAAKEVPLRILMGSEEAQLASEQDSDNFKSRVSRRCQGYCEFDILRPTVDRLVMAGALPAPEEAKYSTDWPDLKTLSDSERAEVLAKQTHAFAEYVSSSVDQIVPELEYFTEFVGLPAKQAKKIVDAAAKMLEEEDTFAQGQQAQDAELAREQMELDAEFGAKASEQGFKQSRTLQADKLKAVAKAGRGTPAPNGRPKPTAKPKAKR